MKMESGREKSSSTSIQYKEWWWHYNKGWYYVDVQLGGDQFWRSIAIVGGQQRCWQLLVTILSSFPFKKKKVLSSFNRWLEPGFSVVGFWLQCHICILEIVQVQINCTQSPLNKKELVNSYIEYFKLWA